MRMQRPAAVGTMTAVVAWASVAHAQPTTAPAELPSVLSTIELTDRPYVDASYGFSIRPFDGCEIAREKRWSNGGDLELVQFFHFALNWGMTVRLSKTTQALTPDAMLAGLEANLHERERGLKVLRRDTLKVAGRDAVLLSASCKVSEQDWLRQQAVVFYKADEFFVIVFNTPLAHQERSEPLFDQIVRSFEILRNAATQELLQKALERGKTELRRLAGEKSLGRKLIQEHYLRFIVNGRDAGYVWMQEAKRTRKNRDGVGLRQEGWLFGEDGTVRRELNETFLSNDAVTERWQSTVETITPAKGTTPATRVAQFEEGLREAEKIIVRYSDSQMRTEDDAVEKVIAATEEYAPAGVITLFPRLVDLGRPELYGFATYSSERRGLSLRTLRVVGRQTVTIGSRPVVVTRIEDSEGLLPPINELYVDADGRLMKVVAGNLQMVAATRDEVVRMYKERVDAVNRLVAQIAGPAPQAAPKPKATAGAKR